MIRFLRTLSVILCVVSVLTFYGIRWYVESRTDDGGPGIHMEEQEITIGTQDGEEAVLVGITAWDEKDGDVTELLAVESLSNFVEQGVREATIAAFDRDGNVAKTVRRVVYSDYTSPRVSLSAPLRVRLNNAAALLECMTVTDSLDGDITENVQITTEKIVSSTTPGEYTMHIQVANSAGDAIDLPVTVEFYDYTLENEKLQVYLNAYVVYTKVGESLDPYAYLKGLGWHGEEYDWDSETPPKTPKRSVVVEDPVDYSTPGVYEIKYTATNTDGYSGSVRLIVIVEA